MDYYLEWIEFNQFELIEYTNKQEVFSTLSLFHSMDGGTKVEFG